MTHPTHIAIFDSGQGGLTLWDPIVRRFPQLNLRYLGDNARCPYGNKSEETITHYTSEAALYCASRHALLLIVACGTASSVAVPRLQQLYRMPIVGIVESFCQDAFGWLCALQGETDTTVAVLGTRFTIKSMRFQEELHRLGAKHVWSRACPLFVPLVEEGVSQGPMAEAAADMYLADMPDNTSIILLACTHYTRLLVPLARCLEKKWKRPVVYKTGDGERLLSTTGSLQGKPVYLLESSHSILAYLESFLQTHQEATQPACWQGKHRIFCTDAPSLFERTARYFTEHELPTVELVQIHNSL